MSNLLTSTYHAVGGWGAMYGRISWKYTAYTDYVRVYIYWLGEGLKTTASDAADYYYLDTSATIKGEVLVGGTSKASWTANASGRRGGDATYSSYVWFKAGGSDANYYDVYRTSSSQTVTFKVTYTVSGYSARTGTATLTVDPLAAKTMTVEYHMNGGEIPDSPHQNSSTQIFTNQENMVYMATSTTGAFSKCTYSFTTTTAYPNHWNVSTMGIVKPGYHTIGTEAWNTKADGTGVKINQDYSSSSTTNPATTKATNGGTEITSDVTVTLYVGWIPNTYTIVYDGNGNTSGSTASSSHTFDVPKTLTPNGFVKDGYIFKGWSTSQAQANSGAVIFKDGQSVSKLTTTNEGTVTLYAVWAAPPTFEKIGDNWYGSNKIWVNIGGVWQPVKKIYTRNASGWQEV